MLNVGGGEVLVILLLALIVLGPSRLPEAARQIGKFMGEVRRMSSGFQQELKSAMDDPLEAAARDRGAAAVKPASPGGPALAPVPSAPPELAPATPTAAENGTVANGTAANGTAKKAATKKAAAKKATAKKAAPRKRAAPLRSGQPKPPSAP